MTKPFPLLRLPLIQAPMAGVQDEVMALAACRAGAMGSLPAAMLSPEALASAIRFLQASADVPFNVNFFAHIMPPSEEADSVGWQQALAPYDREFGLSDEDRTAPAPLRRPFGTAQLEVLQALRPPVVSFHFGLPAGPLLQAVKETGAFVMASATTVNEAEVLAEAGADAVLLQGGEAGGHRGSFLPANGADVQDTPVLLRALAGRLSVPLVAAGGIGCASDVQAALRAGASAVQAGTVFLLCSESRVSGIYRARLQAVAAGNDIPTAVTNVFTGRAARGLSNRAVRELGPISDVAPPFPYAAIRMSRLRAAAEAEGHDDFTPMWCGRETAAFARECPTARQIDRLFCPS